MMAALFFERERGRMATAKAYRHLGLVAPAREAGELF